ncbi:MAG: methyl-accepting chemotaxis protein, partial [Iodobacter sp.]
MSLLIGCAGLVILAVILSATLTWLTKPLLRLNDAMCQLSAGDADLRHRLEVSSGDEIGQTSAAFNQFIVTLAQMVTTIKQQTVELNVQIAQLSGHAAVVTEGSSQQAEAAERTASAIEEVSSSIGLIAENAQAAESVAGGAEQGARQAEQDVRATSAEIEQIDEVVRSQSQLMNGLTQRAGEISNVISVIRGIADQTNLLALNAAIEAARAGEQGRGFAVVADEVRKLAEHTSSATVDISKMISAIQQETRQAASGMELALKKVAQGVDLSKEAANHIAHIVDDTTQMANSVRYIAQTTSEQSKATDDIARNVEKINAMVHDNDSALQHVRESTKNLGNLSLELQHVVDRFKV